MAKTPLTEQFSEPLNTATRARFDIHAGDGNLEIDRLTGNEPVLASGALQYFEKQGVPARNLAADDGQASLTLRGGRASQPWLHLPWSACNGATQWLIHINPTVEADITAHSDGGNLRLNLAGMNVSHVAADTGGGNVAVVLPDQAANLDLTARTGGGNVAVEIGRGVTGSGRIHATSGAGEVIVHIPDDLAARIHIKTGLGKAIVDPRFGPAGSQTYQSPGYDQASARVEVTVSSGAGNVSVKTR